MDFIPKSSLQKITAKYFLKVHIIAKVFYQYLVKSDFRGNAKYLSTEFKCDFLGAFLVKFNRCSVGETEKNPVVIEQRPLCTFKEREGMMGKTLCVAFKVSKLKENCSVHFT